MKKTKSLRNAIKNNVPVIDRNLMLFTDGFNKNIFDAMNVQFNKPNFNIENSQFFFISKDLEIARIKEYLIQKGIVAERIEVIEEWSEMPLSCTEMPVEMLTEIFVDALMRESKYKEYELNRLAILFFYLLKDLKENNADLRNLPNYTYESLPDHFIKSKEFVEDWLEYRTMSIGVLEDYFLEMNGILQMLSVNNKLKDDSYYLLKPNSEKEEIILSAYIRKLDCYNNAYCNKENKKRL